MKVAQRAMLAVASLNFVASVWFSQFVSKDQLAALYVVGSFLLWCLAVTVAE